MSHKFHVGQKVDLVRHMLQVAPLGQYEVCQLMPGPEHAGDEPRYRIKSSGEKHERVVREGDLSPSVEPSLSE